MTGIPLIAPRPIAKPLSQLLPRKPLAPFLPTLLRLNERIPVLLFPIRLETRFVGAELRVRIYPDQLTVETHEAQLNRTEAMAGDEFRTRYDGTTDETARRDAWRVLADRFGSPRAAWIARQIVNYKAATIQTLPEDVLTPPTTRLLPDRFVVTLYKDGKALPSKAGARISAELPLMRALQGGAENSDLFDEGSRWVWDYDRAVTIGMAVTFPLDATLQPPFSHVVAVGLRESLGPAGAAALVEDWLDGQHYTGGVEFLEYGTPTNNTADVKSAYSETHDNPDTTFHTEFYGQANLDPTRSNGGRLRRALGLADTSNVFTNIRLASASSDSYTGEIQAALWPVTGGYFLEAMLGQATLPADRTFVANHFRRFVRARGPYAAMRIGRLPYAVLPVTRVAPTDPTGWLADTSDYPAPTPAETTAAMSSATRLHRVAWALFNRFAALVTRPDTAAAPAPVPRIGASNDPDAELLRILAMEPRSVSWSQRRFVDERMAGMLLVLLRNQFAPLNKGNTWAQGWVTATATTRAPTTALLTALGATSAQVDASPLLHIFGWSDATAVTEALIPGDAALRDLANLGAAAPAGGSTALLYQLLHRALNTPGGAAVQAALQTLVKGIDARVQLATVVPNVSPFDLDGLLRDVLDLCTHRLDAWITSLATQRLEALRATQEAQRRALIMSTPFVLGSPPPPPPPPLGVHIGAYGWVENLAPATPPVAGAATAPGYIHAPSVGQAAAAAVIRNAFLTHDGTGASATPNPFQTDVSAARVRLGMSLLDGVRQGQPLAALLGYQFERGLHDLKLDRYIDDFRQAFPLIAHTEVPATTATDTAEAVAPRNVVDGMQVATKWSAKAIDLNVIIKERNAADIPAVRAGLTSELDRLRDALDAVGDLLLTESAYHAVQGNFDRAAAALDAAAGTGRPPELDAVRTPVAGPGLRHRVCVLLPPAAVPANAGPRTRAEPRLAAWVAKLFADVATVPVTATIRRSLSELGLEPIDVLYMSGMPPAGEDTELERWLRYQVGGGQATLTPDVAGGVADLLERARHLMALVAESAPLRPDALTRPETTLNPAYTQTTLDELEKRVAAAQTDLAQLVAQLDPKTDRTTPDVIAALLAAARFGCAGAVPSSRDEPDLAQRRVTVHEEGVRRFADSRSLYDPAAAAPSIPVAPETRVARAQGALKALFGDGFVALPVFAAPDVPALTSAIDQNGRLSAVEAEDRVLLWLQQVADIHKAVRRLEDVWMIGRAFNTDQAGAAPLTLRVAQLPYCEARPWQALSDAEVSARAGDATTATGECVPPSSGRPRAVLSLVLIRPRGDAIDPSGGIDLNSLSGLLVDQWTETIPADTLTTGVSFQYDAPGTQAPHALLLAVPGRFTTAGYWTTDTLRDIVKDTLDLAKVRLVDPDALREMGGILPALFVPTASGLPVWARAKVLPDLKQWSAALPAVG